MGTGITSTKSNQRLGGDLKNRLKDSRIQEIEKKIKNLEDVVNLGQDDIPTSVDGGEL